VKLFAKLFLALSLLFASTAHAVPMLDLDVDTSTAGIQTDRVVTIGTIFEVEIRITGVTGLFAYNIDVTHNDTVLDATGVTEGPFLSSNGDSTFFAGDDTTNPVNALSTLLSVSTGVSGDGVLFSIQYTALAAGVSFLEFTFTDLADDTQPEPNPIEVQVNGPARIVVQAAPLPSTLLLLGAGLAAIAGLRRRHR
jgi:hypothetical protein